MARTVLHVPPEMVLYSSTTTRGTCIIIATPNEYITIQDHMSSTEGGQGGRGGEECCEGKKGKSSEKVRENPDPCTPTVMLLFYFIFSTT